MDLIQRRRVMLAAGKGNGYILDGLTVWLDGHDLSDSSTEWVDKVQQLSFTFKNWPVSDSKVSNNRLVFHGSQQQQVGYYGSSIVDFSEGVTLEFRIKTSQKPRNYYRFFCGARRNQPYAFFAGYSNGFNKCYGYSIATWGVSGSQYGENSFENLAKEVTFSIAYDGTVAKLYIDGNLMTQCTPQSPTNGDAVVLGDVMGGPIESLVGEIAAFRLYGRCLTAGEISHNYSVDQIIWS